MSDQLLKACDLYAKTSRGPGNREYWVGYLGSLKILIFRNHNAEPDGPSHALFLTPRPPRQEGRQASLLPSVPVPPGGDEGEPF